jgi:hypothetical protein
VSGTLANENRKRGRGKGSSCAVASSQVKKVKKHDFSLQLFILRLGFFQDGDVGVGVFPEGEEVLHYPTALSAGTTSTIPSGIHRDPAVVRFQATRKCFNTPNMLEHSLENRETVECISQFAMLLRVCDRQSP